MMKLKQTLGFLVLAVALLVPTDSFAYGMFGGGPWTAYRYPTYPTTAVGVRVSSGYGYGGYNPYGYGGYPMYGGYNPSGGGYGYGGSHGYGGGYGSGYGNGRDYGYGNGRCSHGRRCHKGRRCGHRSRRCCGKRKYRSFSLFVGVGPIRVAVGIRRWTF